MSQRSFDPSLTEKFLLKTCRDFTFYVVAQIYVLPLDVGGNCIFLKLQQNWAFISKWAILEDNGF
jgi:hypothetical protein